MNGECPLTCLNRLAATCVEHRPERMLPPLTEAEGEAAARGFAGDETAWPVVEESVKRRVGLAALRLQAAEAGAALDRVEALCARWDVVTKGESPTTKAIRRAVRG